MIRNNDTRRIKFPNFRTNNFLTSRHYATSRKITGSIPEVIGFFNLLNHSSRTITLGSTQPLTEMSTRNLPGSKEQSADAQG
jgi:hypothetical protein